MKKILSLLITLLITCSYVYADTITKSKLDNGQTVIIKEVHNNPTVIIDTWVKTGSINETDTNNGVAHFLEHLFFKGSQKYPLNEFDKILESKGAMTNAATSKDYTHFYILIPSKDFETALKLHADMLTNPLLPTAEIDKERHVVIREIEKNNDNPERVLYNNFNKILYQNHPYKREVIGTKAIISNISRDEIVDFYVKNYSPENMITVVVGDVDAEKTKNLIEKYFKDASTTTKPKNIKYPQDKNPQKTESIAKEDINTSYMIMGFKCNQKITDKDSYALDLLATIMGQGRSSRLYKQIKEETQLAQSISAGHVSLKEDSIFMIDANFNPANADKIKDIILKEINNFQTTPVSKEELERAKKMIQRETLYSRESIADTASEIGYSTLLTGDWNFYNEYLGKMNKISEKDIQNVAKKYLQPEHAIISIIAPKETQPADKTNIQNTKNKDYSYKTEPDKFFKPKNHTAKNCQKLENLNKYTLQNGAILITDKHKNNEIIAIDIKIKGGNYTDNKKGTSDILADVMTDGTKKYPKEIYSKISEENGIKIIPSSDLEYFSVRMQCTKPDLPLALDMLNQVINNANLNNEDISKSKKEILYAIKQRRDNATNVVFEELSDELWKNTPYEYSGKILEKTIPSISQKEIITKYKELFVPQNITIGINGDIDEKEMINYFSEVFSQKNGKIVDYNDYKNLFKPIEKTKKITQKQGKEAAWLVFGWQTDGVTNRKDRITLKVINAILGTGMSSRLFSEVRAQKGLAYAVGSTTPGYVNKGSFYIYIGTDPKQVEEAEKAMFYEVERLKKEFVSDKELEDAKNKLKGKAILAQETNAEKANAITLSEQNGNGCDYYFDKFNKEVDEVSISDIITVANKYFSQPYVLSKVLPKK